MECQNKLSENMVNQKEAPVFAPAKRLEEVYDVAVVGAGHAG